MFTGLIEEVGRAVRLKEHGSGGELEIASTILHENPVIGESVAINGTCLTLKGTGKGTLLFDVLQETITLTTLGKAKPGDSVNLERALQVGSRMGGHFLSGHIDTAGKVLANSSNRGQWQLDIGIKEPFLKNCVEKGSIAVNGVSLTIARLGKDNFTVFLIPETLDRTNLWTLRRGVFVNLEFDLIGKYVLRHLEKRDGVSRSLTAQDLADAGFM